MTMHFYDPAKVTIMIGDQKIEPFTGGFKMDADGGFAMASFEDLERDIRRYITRHYDEREREFRAWRERFLLTDGGDRFLREVFDHLSYSVEWKLGRYAWKRLMYWCRKKNRRLR